MSSAVKILPHYNYDDYCQWEGRWELIEGIPYAMSPAPIPQHQIVAGNIFTALDAELKQKKCGCKSYLPIDYRLSDDTVLQPDVLVVCRPITKKYLDFPPVLVVEVLSPATAMKDRNNKFYIYEAQKIPYYLIVDTDKKEVEIYRLDETAHYMLDKHNPSQPYIFEFDDCQASLQTDGLWD